MKRLQQHFFSNDCIFCDLMLYVHTYVDIRYSFKKTCYFILNSKISFFISKKDHRTTKKGGGILYKVGNGLTNAFCSSLKIRLLRLHRRQDSQKKLKPEACWLLNALAIKCKFTGRNTGGCRLKSYLLLI